MANKSRRAGRGRQAKKSNRAQIAAIPILLCVLAYFLYDAVSGDRKKTTLVEPTATVSNQICEPLADHQSDLQWEEGDVAAMKANNPFADYHISSRSQSGGSLVASVEGTNGPSEAVTAKTLREFDVPYVFQTDGKRKAVVDGRVVNFGDELIEGVSLRSVRNGRMILHSESAGSTIQ